MTVDEFEKAEVDEETDNTVVVIAEHKMQPNKQDSQSGPDPEEVKLMKIYQRKFRPKSHLKYFFLEKSQKTVH